VRQGILPKQYCESADSDRLVPIVWSPEDFIITVSGERNINLCVTCGQNGFIGYPVSRKIELPGNWEELLREAKHEGSC